MINRKTKYPKQILFRCNAKGMRTTVLVHILPPQSDRKLMERYYWPCTLYLEYVAGAGQHRWKCHGPEGIHTDASNPETAARRWLMVVEGRQFRWADVKFNGMFYECPHCRTLQNGAFISATVMTMNIPWTDHRFVNWATGLHNPATEADKTPVCACCGKPMWGMKDNPDNLPMANIMSSVLLTEDLSAWEDTTIANPYTYEEDEENGSQCDSE